MIETLTGQGIDVRHACRTLAVSESGYYAWKDRPTSPRELRRIWLAGEIVDQELHVEGRAFAVGDRVVTTRNDRTNDITNGTRGTVSGLDADQRILTVRLDSGKEQQLPIGYVEDGHLDHAYAMTAHRAQGRGGYPPLARLLMHGRW